MNREDIIRMAREASVEGDEIAIFTMSGLERFFQSAYAAGAAAERERNTKEFPVQFGSVKAFEDWCADIRRNEREACAKVCVELEAQLEEFEALNRAATAIRARGNT